MREYLVIYEKGGSGWGAYAPDLPGLAAAAESLEEVKQLMAAGLQLHLESLLEHGDAVPAPNSHAGIVRTEICENYGQLAKSA